MTVKLGVTLLLLCTLEKVVCFRNLFTRFNPMHQCPLMASSAGDVTEQQRPVLSKILLSGFVSKASNFVDSDVFTKVFKAGFTPNSGSGSGKMFVPASTTSCRQLTAITDDIPFAKKRLVSPKSVYSGLVDVLNFSDNLESSLAEQDAWVAFNVATSDLLDLSRKAASSGIKRVVFAVNLKEEERSQIDLEFSEACSILRDAGTDFTIIKYGDVAIFEEAKFPYRVVRGSAPLPNSQDRFLSSGDLMRIITEVIDIPKTYGAVYGIGAGTKVDTEILVYMKSQGWPERVQVGLLVGDMMEKIEKLYEEEAQKRIGEYNDVRISKKKNGSYEEPNYLLNM
jgi:hypothetical protein